MKLKQKEQKLVGILIVSMLCLCFAGCKENSEEKDPVALGNQNMEASNDEQASAENMMEEETNVVAEDESEDEVTEEVSFDGYEFIAYDLFDPTKDIIAFNIPNGFEPMFGQEEKQEGRIAIGREIRLEDEDHHRIILMSDYRYYDYFEYDGVDEERKEFYDSQRKILDTLEIGEIETQFGSAKIYKIELAYLSYPDDSLQDSNYREMMEELGFVYYEKNGVFYNTGEEQVAVFCIDGQHVEVSYSGEQDFEDLLHQMFDL